jgi:lipid-A-disaccharide synthase
MKYYIIAGEASGDMHGANLMKSLAKTDANAEFRYWGGNKMAARGGKLVKHYKDHAVMGIIEVLLHIRKILKNIRYCKQDILDYQPNILILIDYPGFNLKMAKFASNHGIKVAYYISPKIWAWKTSRVHHIKKYVDRMYVILPFEKTFYQKYDYHVEYVGNPLVDEIEEEKTKGIPRDEFLQKNALDNKPIIAVLPGSRNQEIDLCLSHMIAYADKYKDYQFIIAGLSTIDRERYEKYIISKNIKLIFDQTYALLKHADLAVVTSGTATLETALFDVPQVVCYKFNTISYYIGKPFVHIKFFSLVNLIMDMQVVKELLQFNLSEKIKDELDELIFNEMYLYKMKANYKELKNKLGGPGASYYTAKKIHKYLTNDIE